VLPKQIWSYWDKEQVPPAIQEHYENNRKVLYDWKVTLLSDKTLAQLIDVTTFPIEYQTLIPQHKADYIRLALLQKYGGVWMDATIIVNSREVFNKLYDEAVEKNSQASLFTLGDEVAPAAAKLDPYFIENWFIMAPAESPVIGAWFHEFDAAVRMSFLDYQVYIRRLDVKVSNRMNMYLTQHECMQAILHKYPEFRQMILLYMAEDSMLNIQYTCKWDLNCIKHTMNDTRRTKALPYIKLRGCDRAR